VRALLILILISRTPSNPTLADIVKKFIPCFSTPALSK
jgi:hypothetical protein